MCLYDIELRNMNLLDECTESFIYVCKTERMDADGYQGILAIQNSYIHHHGIHNGQLSKMSVNNVTVTLCLKMNHKYLVCCTYKKIMHQILYS